MLGFRQLDLSLGQKLALSSSIRRSSDGQVVANQTHFWSEIRKGLGDTSLWSVWPKSPNRHCVMCIWRLTRPIFSRHIEESKENPEPSPLGLVPPDKLDTRSESRKSAFDHHDTLDTWMPGVVVIGLFCTYFTPIQAVTVVKGQIDCYDTLYYPMRSNTQRANFLTFKVKANSYGSSVLQ